MLKFIDYTLNKLYYDIDIVDDFFIKQFNEINIKDFYIDYSLLKNNNKLQKFIYNHSKDCKFYTKIPIDLDIVKQCIDFSIDTIYLDFNKNILKNFIELDHNLFVDKFINTFKPIIETIHQNNKKCVLMINDSFQLDIVDLVNIVSNISKLNIDNICLVDNNNYCDSFQIKQVLKNLKIVSKVNFEFYSSNLLDFGVSNYYTSYQLDIVVLHTNLLDFSNTFVKLRKILNKLSFIKELEITKNYDLIKLHKLENILIDYHIKNEKNLFSKVDYDELSVKLNSVI